MENFKVSAVKVSAKIPDTNLDDVEKFCEQNLIKTKRFNREHLIVYDTFTFVFFKKSSNTLSDQHCNITKLQSTNVTRAIEDLAWIINSEPKLIFHSIDNITATGNLEKKISLDDFIDANSDLHDYITYNPERVRTFFSIYKLSVLNISFLLF